LEGAGNKVQNRLTIQAGRKLQGKQAEEGKPAVKITEAPKMLRQVHNANTLWQRLKPGSFSTPGA